MRYEGNQSERILDTAYQCLAERGYTNVSLRDIALRANVALSQLNYYYKSKEGLFAAVMKRALENFLNDMCRTISQGVSPEEKVRLLSEYCNTTPKENAELPRLFFDFAVQSMWIPAFKNHLHSFFAQVREMVIPLIDAYRASGASIPCTDRQMASFIMGAFLGVIGQRIWDMDSSEDSGEFMIAAMLFQ